MNFEKCNREKRDLTARNALFRANALLALGLISILHNIVISKITAN